MPISSINTYERLIERYCNRWSLKALSALELAGNDTMRFKDIREKTGCTSDKMLDKAITELCDDGLVKKNFYPDNPHRPDYVLTERGKSLLLILHQLKDWVSENQHDIMNDRTESIDRREKYDK